MSKSSSSWLIISIIFIGVISSRIYIYLDRKGVNFAWSILIIALVAFLLGLVARKIKGQGE
jgi:hypothetical protein